MPELSKKILTLWLTMLVSVSCCIDSFAQQSNSKPPLRLFLPIESVNFPQLIATLENKFSEYGFNDIKVATVDDWHDYQQGLRHGRVGLYLAPPHFAAWAIEKHSFQPLLRISKPLSYVITTTRQNPTLFEVNDLAGRTVCTGNPLNLDYLLLNQVLAKSVRSAKIEIVDSVEQEMHLPETTCDAFSVSLHIFEKFTINQPNRWIRLQQSGLLNNYVLLAHPDVPPSQLSNVKAYLSSDIGQQLLSPVLNLFADGARLIPARVEDYPATYSKTLDRYWQ